MNRFNAKIIISILSCILMVLFIYPAYLKAQNNNSNKVNKIEANTSVSEVSLEANKLYKEFDNLYNIKKNVNDALKIVKQLVLNYRSSPYTEPVLNELKMDDLLELGGELSLSKDIKELTGAVNILEYWRHRLSKNINITNKIEEEYKVNQVLFVMGNIYYDMAEITGDDNKRTKGTDYYTEIKNSYPKYPIGQLIIEERKLYEKLADPKILDNTLYEYCKLAHKYVSLRMLPQFKFHQYKKALRLFKFIQYPYKIGSKKEEYVPKDSNYNLEDILFWIAEMKFRIGDKDEAQKIFMELIDKYPEHCRVKEVKEWFPQDNAVYNEAVSIIEKFYEESKNILLKGARIIFQDKVSIEFSVNDKYILVSVELKEEKTRNVILLNKESLELYYIPDDKDKVCFYAKSDGRPIQEILYYINAVLESIDRYKDNKHVLLKEKNEKGYIIDIIEPLYLLLSDYIPYNFVQNMSVESEKMLIKVEKKTEELKCPKEVSEKITFSISTDNTLQQIVINTFDKEGKEQAIIIDNIKIKESYSDEYYKKIYSEFIFKEFDEEIAKKLFNRTKNLGRIVIPAIYKRQAFPSINIGINKINIDKPEKNKEE